MRLKNVMIKALTVLLAAVVFIIPVAGTVKADDSDIVTLTVNYRIKPTSKDSILKRINEIRWEACKEGITTGGRKLTEADYVPIRWSQDMEEIAYIRALESTILFSHTRPNGQSCFSVQSVNGQSSYGECIASIGDAIPDINLWYSEKSTLVNGESGVTGHYEALINPNNLFVGIASCGVTVGEFTSQAPVSEDQMFTQQCVISANIEVRRSDIDFYVNGPGHVKPGEEQYFYLKYSQMIITGDVVWTSDDPSVITVESDDGIGVVKALKAGTATLTATCAGKSASIKVVVAESKWRKNSRGWWYDYGDGTYPRGQLATIDGKDYLFDWEGYMYTGWYEYMYIDWYGFSSYWYYFAPSGEMAYGWTKVDGTWYYMDPESGIMQTGWKLINGTWYYMQGSGAMVTGWQKIGSTWYYFNGSGAMVTGWQEIGGIWYYMQDSGAMVTGWKLINGAWYYFNGSGAMLTGWQKIGGTWYYLYGSGAMATGFATINGSVYYFNSSGAMQTGWKLIDGTWYYLKGSGAMSTGWLKLGTVWYYFDQNGAMQTGIVEIDGVKNSFSDSGAWIGVVEEEEPAPEEPTPEVPTPEEPAPEEPTPEEPTPEETTAEEEPAAEEEHS